MSELSTFIGGASGAKPWVSGAVIKQYAYVISPTDLQLYQRKTATGSGTTDPVLDKTNYRPVSIDRIASITNAWSSGTATTDANADTGSYFGAQTVTATPTLTAGVRTSILSLSGRGALRFAGWVVGLSATGTLRYELEIDGAKVFDATYAGASAARYAIAVGGALQISGSNAMAAFDKVDFSSSCQIFATSSTTSSAFRFRNAYVGYQS